MFWTILLHNFTRSRIHGENAVYRDDIILLALNNNATDRRDGAFRPSYFSLYYTAWILSRLIVRPVIV